MLTNRREFLLAASAAVGSAVVLRGGVPVHAAAATVKSGTDLVTLGKTGIKTTVLGIGTGTRGGREQRELGEEGFLRLARHAFERGIRYIDTADTYKTHPLVAKALKELPRDQVFLLSKTWAKDAEKAKQDIERLRQELGVETIDAFLIHCMTKKNWPPDMRPVIDVLVEAKRKGQIRAIGVSCHTFDALTDAVACDEIDLHLVRINPFGKKMEGTADEIAAQIQKMHQKGRGVLGMKIFGEGLLKTREERLASLKYVLGLGTVQAFTIGFGNTEQIDETLELIQEAAA